LCHDLIADRYPDFAHRLGACSFHELFCNDGEVFGTVLEDKLTFLLGLRKDGLRAASIEGSKNQDL
jgi:hypothetical protein